MNSLMVGYHFGNTPLKLVSYADGGFILSGETDRYRITVSMTPLNIFSVCIKEDCTLRNIVPQNASVWVIITDLGGRGIYDDELLPHHLPSKEAININNDTTNVVMFGGCR